MVPSHNSQGNSPVSSSAQKEFSGRTITLGIPLLDDFLGGFSSAAPTLIDGRHPFIDDILPLLSVTAITTFSHNIIYIDGGNSINPHKIICAAKRQNTSPQYVLRKIMTARAFTLYQLDTLIGRLEQEIMHYRPTVLIISCITSLLLDKNVKRMEAESLLNRWISEIKQLTHRHNLISLVTSRIPYKTGYSSSLWEILYNRIGTIIQITEKKRGMALHLMKHNKKITFSPAPLYQKMLDEFNGGTRHG